MALDRLTFPRIARPEVVWHPPSRSRGRSPGDIRAIQRLMTIPEDHPRRVELRPAVAPGDTLARRTGRLRRWSRRVAPAALVAAAALTINPGLRAQAKRRNAGAGG
jgi:hypothetical protein